MPRPSLIRAALAGILALGPVCAGVFAPVAAAPADAIDPLVVHLDTMSAVLPRTGDVEITGTVTNVSDDTFTRINLHAFSSQTPILSTSALADSAASDPGDFVGQRVTVPGTFATVDTLAPGETASFADSVPVELLEIPDEAGVYWIGIHALGDGATPRDEIADGRARTFIPTRPTGRRTQEASVILPLRQRVWYDADGRIGGSDRWAKRLGEGGSLDAVLDMADSAGSTPYSWLVDPAVLIAIKRLSYGNPQRNLLPDPAVPGQEPTPTETPEGEETSSPGTPETLTPPGADSGPAPTDDDLALADLATAWLARFGALVGAEPVLTLPFGDLDIAAAVRHDPARYTDATDRSAVVMAQLGLGPNARPAVAPASRRLTPEAIGATPAGTVILLGDNAFTLPPRTPNSVVRLLGHPVVLTSAAAASGGPAPTAANDPLALRQRLLSEAALRVSDRVTAPVVITLPSVWSGEDAGSFFTDLEQPWLEVVPLADVAARTARGVPVSDLAYTDVDLEAELPTAAFTQARATTDRSTVLEQVLALQTTIELQVRDEVLVTLSEMHRKRPRIAARAAERVEEEIDGDLGKIAIEGPTAVTLSSDSGPLGSTLVNGLDQPVTVRVDAVTDSDLVLTGDSVRTLGPRARSAIRFKATTTQPGLHSVRLLVASVDGVPLGSYDDVPIRAAQVSTLIWIVMAGGALVLFGMIGYRLPGQIRARRRESSATAADVEQDDTADPDIDTADPETGVARP